MAVVGADLHIGVASGSRGLPLLTPAKGTLMARRPGSRVATVVTVGSGYVRPLDSRF
jgi:hypothetical protein